MNKKILLVGGGGHCKSVLDSLLLLNQFSEIGIIDVAENIGKKIMGVSIIGCDDNLVELFSRGYSFAFVTVGSIGNPMQRIKLFGNLVKIGFKMSNIIDPSATVSHFVKMESGIFIGKNAVVNSGSLINKCAIINSAAVVEHDCIIGEFVHIAPGAVLGGEVQIGANTHIGANSVIKQQIKIGSDSIIGMGSVVLKEIESNIIAYGNPCKVVSKR